MVEVIGATVAVGKYRRALLRVSTTIGLALFEQTDTAERRPALFLRQSRLRLPTGQVRFVFSARPITLAVTEFLLQNLEILQTRTQRLPNQRGTIHFRSSAAASAARSSLESSTTCIVSICGSCSTVYSTAVATSSYQ